MNAVPKRGSVLLGSLAMLVISLLLFWLPAIGAFVAGVVGGKVAGGVARGILAALLPAFVLGLLFLLFGAVLTGFIVVGFIAGAGIAVLVLTHVGFLLLGAIVGGLLA